MRKKGCKLLTTALAVAMSVSVFLGSTATTYAAVDAPDGYTTDENGITAYKQVSGSTYDVMGYLEGAWRQITYGYGGYKARVNGTSDLQVTCEPGFIANGAAVLFTYHVKNPTEEAKNYRFWIGADTKVDGNDASQNSVNATRDIVVMQNGNIAFFAFPATPGVTVVSTEYDYLWEALNDLRQPQDAPELTEVYDSAFIAYWPESTLAPGETRDYVLASGMADASTLTTVLAMFRGLLTPTSTPPTLEQYEIIEGMQGQWTSGSAEKLRFRSNADISRFLYVEVDDVLVGPEHYDVTAGSTVVDLRTPFLSTLSVGEHTMTIVSSSYGYEVKATTTFTILAPGGSTIAATSPKTGDNSNLMLWMAVIAMMGSVAAAGIYRRKSCR